MILIDSSIWIDFLNKKSSNVLVGKLDKLLTESPENVCVCDLIITEVLQGIDNDTAYRKTAEMLKTLKLYSENPEIIYFRAAEIYRKCRKKGLTIRSTIDAIIAATAIFYKLELFTNDRNFQKIASVEPLKLY